MKWVWENKEWAIPTIVAVVGIIIALVGLAIPFIIERRRRNRENEQNRQIGPKFHLLQMSQSKKPASLQLEVIVPLLKHARITNKGEGVARKIKVESLDLQILLADKDLRFPYKNLLPNESFDIYYQQNYPDLTGAEVDIMWDDDIKTNNVKEVTIDIK